MELRSLVGALRAAADHFDEAGRRLSSVDPGATAFGAGGLGLLGDVAREAHRHCQAALDARVREAVAHARRLRELAAQVSHAAREYADAEDAAVRPLRDVESP